MTNSLQSWSVRVGKALVVVAVWFALIISCSAQEFRAAWADVFHVGMGSQAEVNNLVSTLVSGHYNVVIYQVVGYMDTAGGASHGAMYKSNILPRSSRVTASFDPLAYLCQQAHANGIEVHAWLGGSGASMYRVSNSWPPAGNATLAAHPEWMSVPRSNSEGGVVVGYVDGSNTYYSLDMGSPDVQEYIVSIVRELVTNYPIDGINWDDEIDGPVYSAGVGFPAVSVATYTNSGLARFQRNTGFVGTPAATDASYNNYRRRFKNELMARVQAEIQSIKTNPRQPLRHTSAALAYSPVPPSCDFTTSTPYLYYCDWAGMLQHGWLDAVIPQTYSSSTFNSWADRIASCWQYNRQIFPGMGGYLNTDSTIASMINYTRSKGLKGNSIYSYAVPTSASGSGSGWWAYAAANVYTNVVSTPPMPWRNPATATEGIVWGRVKDFLSGNYVDDATVTVAGASTVKTDGNGYYVATLVPATAGGTAHAVTASKTGMTPQTTNAIALAGDIVRYDLFLNVVIPVSPPSGLTATALSTSQIKLAWTDNATNETGFVVARASVSGGPYTDIAALAANSTGYTNSGLAGATTYYYVVRGTNASVSSANSAQAGATTFTNPAPAITSQPQNQTVVVGNNATFSVVASGSAPLSYQWRFNGAAILGATSNSFVLTAAQYSNAGNYSVMVTNSFGSVLSANASLAVLSGPPTIQLTNIWNIQAGSRSNVTTGNTERGICINPSTSHVLLVSRSAQIAGNLGVFVLNADTGSQLGTMSTSGISGTATFLLNKIGATDDGVIYGANLTTASDTSPFIIYRWANEGATPTVAYSGAPDGGTTLRWGDSFSVIGSGVNTKIIVSGSGATNVIVFTTSNGTSFVANTVNPTPAVSVAEFSRGLQLVGNNTFYSKNRGTNVCNIYTYNVAAHNASTSSSIAPLDLNMQAISVVTNYNLIAGVIDDNTSNNSGHSVKVYDISSASSPVLVTNVNFLTFGSGTNSSNSNFAADIDTDGTRIVALDTQNGVVALKVVVSNPPPVINSLTVLQANQREFQLNLDPGNFVIQASSDFINWLDLPVTRTNGIFQVFDPETNSPRYYRTKN
jgi:uncharacterized lipoprotein YddW (UPF0748 family)